jgi:hypothetical protein
VQVEQYVEPGARGSSEVELPHWQHFIVLRKLAKNFLIEIDIVEEPGPVVLIILYDSRS